MGVLVFCAASRRLRARDKWIGWTEEQRRRRLPLVVNNCRFLLLPHKTFPNLGSRSLRLTLDRLSADDLLTVKDNQPTLRANLEKLVSAPPADFPPSLGHPDAGRPA